MCAALRRRLGAFSWRAVAGLLIAAAAMYGCTAIFGLDEGQPFPGTGGAGAQAAGGGGSGATGGGGQGGCDTAGECDDHKPCTTDTCDVGSHTCSHTNLPNGQAAAALQTAGDCQLMFCVDGVLAPATDDLDLPDDDNPCTDDGCSEGSVVATPVNIGTPCTAGGGTVCNGDAADPRCVACNAPSDCTGLPPDDECQTRTCAGHVCDQAFTPNNTPLGTQTDRDCKRRVCDGTGGQRDDVDQGDLPVDMELCTQDLCDASGNPSNPPTALNSPCGANGTLFCDGAGACQGCNTDSQCAADSFCRDTSCNVVSHTCGFAARNNGQALPSPPQFAGDPSQAAGDCHELRCDAVGDVANVIVTLDIPSDDGNQCTSESCSVAGAPQHPNTALNSACSQGGSFCNGNGTCVACNNNSQCGDPSCLCRVCTSNICAHVADNTTANCQTAGDCQTRLCDGSGATKTSINAGDVPADDGNICTTEQCVAGVAQHTNNSAACNDNSYCNGSDTCSGGTCSVHAGNPCLPLNTSDANCAQSCNEAGDNCIASDPIGTGCSDGQYCNGTDTCNGSGSCSSHTGNPCLPLNTADGNCAQSCNEASDTCTANDPPGTGCNDGLFCNGADSCNASGSCAQHAGDPCPPNPSDANCATSCNEPAQNCTASDPTNTPCNDGAFCNGPDTCNGIGICGQHVGDPCPGPDGDANCQESCDEPSDSCTGNDPNGVPCLPGLFCNLGSCF